MTWVLFFQGLKIVLDALAAASWPIAIGLIAFYFREPIRTLIPRIKRWKVVGNEAEFEQALPTQESPESGSRQVVLPQPGSPPQLPPPDAVREEVDQILRANLEATGQTDEWKLAWAVRGWSLNLVERLHETNYRLMFGSQLAAMRHLNQLGGEAPAEDFRPYYDRAVAAWPDLYRDRPFEMWGQFLVDAGYVRLVPDTEPERVQLTPRGQDFLVWMIRAKVPEAKPLG